MNQLKSKINGIMRPTFKMVSLIILVCSFVSISIVCNAQYNQPNISFTTNGGCSGSMVTFMPNLSGLQVQDSLTTVIWNYGDGTQNDTITTFPTAITMVASTHTYIGAGVFYPSLTVINRNQLDSTFIHRIVVSPQGTTPTATIPYYEDFEANGGGWYQEEINPSNSDSLWQWGIAVGANINTVQSGNKVWGTRTANVPTTYAQDESGWVYSPCFDLSQLDKPMVSLDIWKNTLSNIDGAVLEYYDNTVNTWKVLGTGDNRKRGIDWYDSDFVLSRPGNQTVAIYPVGWTGINTTFENARYRLDHSSANLSNQTNVRFRVAFASDINTLAGSHDGFAFDNVWIGNRTRNVLVEHFSGEGYPGIGSIENALYNTLDGYNGEASYIQYHLNTYTSDPLHSFNAIAMNERKLLYSIADPNKVVVGGKSLVANTSNLSDTILDREMLEDPKFKLSFLNNPFIYTGNNVMTASIKIEALENLPLNRYTLYVVITEDSLVTSTGHITKSVLRATLPDVGFLGTLFNQSWSAGSFMTTTVNWNYDPVKHPDISKLKILAFIQKIDNNGSKEVYQVIDQTLYSSNTLPNHLGIINGRVAIDSNSNCLADSSEIGSNGVIVSLNNNGQTYHASTNSLGNYEIILDTGTYTMNIVNATPYTTVCPMSQVVTAIGATAQTVDWALRDSILCPYLEVDLAAPFLRQTGGGSNYTVSYCNRGTVQATNAYVEVDLDPDLLVQGTSIPINSQNGTTYTFNIGNVAIGGCGSFTINVLVDTNSLIGRTLCSEAHIYPDTVCLPNLWAGAILEPTSVCSDDTIYFTISNIGASMSAFSNYTVAEDNIMMLIDSVKLGGGQSTTISHVAKPGSTYRIIVDQETGYPSILGDPRATAVTEACTFLPDGGFNSGFVTNFSNGNSSPFIAIDCQQSISSYDPNDKVAQPSGYGAQHSIERNTPLDYKIRFQNTGTDTAFNIVIIDTLSMNLDVGTLVMGASSHAYTWEVEGQALIIRFEDILLVDSLANEPFSHGFIRYRIQPKTTSSIGTVIHNQAAIYFDFNPPILTNTTWHTIDENFVLLDVAVEKVFIETIDVLVCPNPFEQMTLFEVNEEQYKVLELTIFDQTGRLVKTRFNYNDNRIQLSRERMTPGLYFYQLKGDNALISIGKVTVF